GVCSAAARSRRADHSARHSWPGDRRCVWAACCSGGGWVTSNGQRFRRRSLRRGYKVDEVDTFLDRVEATLNGDSIASPVPGQEVHDVVFRVRFGGYDEWQVDLHLDRVERQLADQEGTLNDRFGANRPPADRMPERMPERLGPDTRGGRMGEPMPDRMT